MKRDYFINKTHCQLGVISNTVTPEEITEKLGIKPDRSFKKGESSVSRHSGTTLTKPHNFWAIRSEPIVAERESISPHISYLSEKIGSKLSHLEKLKNDPNFEVSIWIWIETDNAGIAIDLTEKEMTFLNSCSNNVHISFLTNDDIEE